MYPDHFGLRKPLSDGAIARQSDVFIGAREQTVVDRLTVALSCSDAVVMLTGPHGVGKTTLSYATLEREGTTRQALAWLNETALCGSELPELLLTEFGIDARRMSRVERLQLWRQFLGEMRATDSRVCVIVERADAVDGAVLRALESLTAADPGGAPGVSLMLLGQPALEEMIEQPALEALKQRVRLHQRLEPLTVEEAEAYWRHRAERAGGEYDAIFAPDAVGMLHSCASGLPRVMNNLCESSLTLAAMQGDAVLTAERVQAVAAMLPGSLFTDTRVMPAQAGASAAELPVLTDAVEQSTAHAGADHARVDDVLAAARQAARPFAASPVPSGVAARVR